VVTEKKMRNPYQATRTKSWKAAEQILEYDSCRLWYLPTPPEAIDAAFWVWRQAWKRADGRVTVSVDEFPLRVDLWRHAAKLVYEASDERRPLRPEVWAISRPYQLVP
jgi:hypothetical protein